MSSRILLTDDDAELRETVSEILSECGFEVMCAENSEEALKLAETFKPHLVITDNMMPGIGGMALISLIKSRMPSVKVIMITAFATVDNAVNAMKAGADDYLAKPFKKEELAVAVRKCIEEGKFARCLLQMNMDDTLSCISNSIRRQILFMLYEEGKMRFMDITRKLGIDDHTKVNFHLKALRQNDMIHQNDEKEYVLSSGGMNIIDCLKVISGKVSY
ncbi:MAG: response regulator [Deferribacterales bacterium]